MDFRLSSEQNMLRDGARRFVAQHLDFDARRTREGKQAGDWAEMAGLGWFMLPVGEESGGLGGRPEDIAIIAEELGRGIADVPLIQAALLPARLIEQAGSAAQRDAYLPSLMDGTMRFAAALQDAGAGFALQPRFSHAQRSAGGHYVLAGRKMLVLGGDVADVFVVSAMVDQAVALFVVDGAASGVVRRDYDAIDGRRMSDLQFDNVVLSESARLGGAADVSAIIEAAVDESILALCADTLGCMDKAIEMTASYLNMRQQFGQPLGHFQSLQHGIANLFIEANDSRSLLYRAIAAFGQAAPQRKRAISACKVKVIEAGRSITGAAVHFHGGIGVTTEYAVGHYLRRVLVSEQMFGNSQLHFERYLAQAA
jgi:acyl-CoA dehydrogenase